MTAITRQQLKAVLSYDATNGVFRWKVRPANCIHIGDVAGGVNGDGYVQIRVGGTKSKAHRLAWLYMTGAWPCGEIDHKNGLRHDNRWSNLRDGTKSLNQQNSRWARRTNTTGFLGVSPFRGGRFRAHIRADGKERHIGLFDSAEAAHFAYVTAKRRLHPGCTI